MSTARLVFAGTLLCMWGAAFAQSPPATASTGDGVLQNPPAATAGNAKSGAAAATPDAVAKKTFNESRSNALRKPGDTSTATPGTDASAKKTFNESRSNALRTPGDTGTVTPGADASTKKTFNESRSNALRSPGDTNTVSSGADASAKKTFNESRGNRGPGSP